MDFINRAMLFSAVLFLRFVPFIMIIEVLAGRSAATRLIKHFGLTGEAAGRDEHSLRVAFHDLRRDHRVELRGLRARRDRRRCRDPGTLRASLRSRDPRHQGHSSPARVAGHPPRLRRTGLLGRRLSRRRSCYRIFVAGRAVRPAGVLVCQRRELQGRQASDDEHYVGGLGYGGDVFETHRVWCGGDCKRDSSVAALGLR